MDRYSVMLFLGLFAVVGSAGILTMLVDYGVTGAATTATTTSTAVISAYLSISATTNLSGGVDFGTIGTLPSSNVNASANLNSSNLSMYGITVSSDSNVNVDFCIKSDKFNTTANDEIPLSNYTYTYNATNSFNASNQTSNTYPNYPGTGGGETAISTSYAKTVLNVGQNSTAWYRFFLDVPAGQAAGTYTSTLTFEGVQTGTSC